MQLYVRSPVNITVLPVPVFKEVGCLTLPTLACRLLVLRISTPPLEQPGNALPARLVSLFFSIA